MDGKKKAADRIRPILEAMERSIDAARRQRIKDSGDPREEEFITPSAAAPASPHEGGPAADEILIGKPEPAAPKAEEDRLIGRGAHAGGPSENGEGEAPKPARLKARPKRRPTLPSDEDGKRPYWRSQGG